MNENERVPLSWPTHRVRTRPQDQKDNRAWKKSWGQYMDALEKELTRMGVTRFVVTWNGSGSRQILLATTLTCP